MNTKTKEFLNIVDDNDMVVDLSPREEVHRLGLLHREIHIWFFDKDKNVYFQKTNFNKFRGGLFDASVGGHVKQGEEYEDAALREMSEESGILAFPSNLSFLTKFHGISGDKSAVNNFIRSVYIYKIPVREEALKKDSRETENFYKFSFDYLAKITKKDSLMFHQFILTDEIPFVLEYLINN